MMIFWPHRRRYSALGPLAVTAALLGFLSLQRAVLAQPHHGGGASGRTDPTDAGLTGGVGIAFEAGSVDIVAAAHDYQAYSIAAGARWRRFGLDVRVPYYRIDLGPEWDDGPGDPHVEARAILVVLADIELSASVAAMAPLGDDEIGLGMGHWMFMAGGQARIAAGRFEATAALGYGGGLSSSGAHEDHGGAWPPVAPMNAHEIEPRAARRVAVLPWFGVGASLAAGLPLDGGEHLIVARTLADVALGSVHAGISLARGLADHPLDLSLGAEAGVWF